MTRKLWIGVIGVGAALLLGALLLFVWTSFDEVRAGDSTAEVLEELAPLVGDGVAEGRDMAKVKLGERSYVGVLEVPALGLELPVMATWSDELLRDGPCRYYGTAADDSLVIAGFNYDVHFGRLAELAPGDEVTLVEMDGTVDSYEVVEVLTLDGSAVEEMTSSDYALTLFTRSYDGSACTTVRCERV